MNYHIIGDIHGQADKLERLLWRLGYDYNDGVYHHPESKVVFLGDFIDRGPHQRRVLDIVRPMVEQGHAFAVMGNHEFNAICFHSVHPETLSPLRPHSNKNSRQHEAFLKEYGLKDEETRSVIEWFKSLPLYLEVKDEDSGHVLFRAIHACWHQAAIDRTPEKLTDEYLLEAATKGSQAYDDIEVLLKGPEIPLPEDQSFHDKDGHERHNIRIKWWPLTKRRITYQDLAMVPEGEEKNLPASAVPTETFSRYLYPEQASPVFFGHYWLTGKPQPISHNLACLDYSAGKGGNLVAYRWDSRRSWQNNICRSGFVLDVNGELKQLRKAIEAGKAGRARIFRGAEVIISIEPLPHHHEHYPNDIVVVTHSESLARKLSWVLIRLRDIFASYLDFRNKYYFYGAVANAAKTALEQGEKGEAVLLAAVTQAEIIGQEFEEATRQRIQQLDEERVDRKLRSPDSLMQFEDDSPFKEQPMIDHILRYLAGYDIQFAEPYYGNPSTSREVIMTYRASGALPVLEAYFNLNDVPFQRIAGPVRQISIKEAEKLEALLQQYRKNHWITRVPVPRDTLENSASHVAFSNIESYRILGEKPQVGWKVEVQYGNRGIIEPKYTGCYTYSKTATPNRYQIYFHHENEMQAFTDKCKAFSIACEDNKA